MERTACFGRRLTCRPLSLLRQGGSSAFGTKQQSAPIGSNVQNTPLYGGQMDVRLLAARLALAEKQQSLNFVPSSPPTISINRAPPWPAATIARVLDGSGRPGNDYGTEGQR